MKILWLTNVSLPMIDVALGKKRTFEGGGWLTGLANQILATDEYELVVCYPNSSGSGVKKGKLGKLSFYGLDFNIRKLNKGTENFDFLVKSMVPVLKEENPDVIHIQGSEFQYHYAMYVAAQECNMVEKIVVSIQGLVSVYAKHAFANLPMHIVYRRSLREILSGRGIAREKRALERRGQYEIDLLRNVKYVMGRTNWDYACAKQINENIVYLHCNETLRNSFYTGKWEYSECVPHSIFVSQGSKPIKALHMLIEAVKYIKLKYPDIKIYVAGRNILNNNRITGNSYGYYLNKLINKYGLKDQFVFLGTLNEEQMKENMLKANVFVSPSSIENSPNSLGEAMLLGVPAISSDVGGVVDMMVHQKEGIIYPFDEPYMLAQYVSDIFDDVEYAVYLGKNASERARHTHNAQENARRIFECYERIIAGVAEEIR